ncbi:MAG: hypothetical protein AB1757_27625 [Acidobacteriota bacterium]
MINNRSISIWVAILAFAVTPGCISRHSTYRADEFLIAKFQAHKSEFNTLLEMFQVDKGLIYFAYDQTIPENPQSVGISPDRLAQYRRLFSVLGLNGMAAEDRQTGARDEIWFFTSIEGARRSTFKHYAYVIKPAKGVIQDLDKDGSKATPYRQIENNWYLALDDAD